MTNNQHFDVIIVGGSYSGLAAAMALGRAMRHVLIIDGGEPCNRQTPQSHNFITQDGKSPHEISMLAKQQVEQYDTVTFLNGLAADGVKTRIGYEIVTDSGQSFSTNKIIFATGIKDILPNIEGFAACWGISVLHCPYCHGYEVRNTSTGILGDGAYGFEFAALISNWTKDLTLFTNGKSTLTSEEAAKIETHNIGIVEKEIEKLAYSHGYVQSIVFKDGTSSALKALYARPPFEQHCNVPEILGCEVTEEGYLKVDAFQRTSVTGIFACGDNTSRMRTVANAVSTGTTAGMMVNREMVFDGF